MTGVLIFCEQDFLQASVGIHFKASDRGTNLADCFMVEIEIACLLALELPQKEAIPMATHKL